MSRTYFRLCRSCGDMHQMDRWPHNCEPPRFQHSANVNAPYVIRDGLPGGVNGLYHHGVARKIDSKSGYRKATKESGCVEVGNEYSATRMREIKEIKTEVVEAAVNDALHRQGVSSESDVGEFIT